MKKIVLVNPRGFCAGVQRAIEMVQRALDKYPLPIYCLHELVHNEHVVAQLRADGVIFINDIASVPAASVLIFSAHGVSPAVRMAAAARDLHTIDATCPFVQKVHVKVKRYTNEGYMAILIGDRQHAEMIGIKGEAPAKTIIVQTPADVEKLPLPRCTKVAVMTQTTLSQADTEAVMQALIKRYPNLRVPPKNDICYATLNRQYAAQKLGRLADAVLVLGSRSSSNTQRLVEVVRQTGTPAFLIEQHDQARKLSLQGIEILGITAGASTAEDFVQDIVQSLRHKFAVEISEFSATEEQMILKAPKSI